MGLLEKFGAEQGEHHPGPLTWPGSDAGFPILGKVAPNLHQDEYENIEHRFTYHGKEFKSWVLEEHAEYLYVQERIANGWFALKQHERLRDPEHRGWITWLEWVQIYGVLPKNLLDQGGPDAIREYIQKNRMEDVLPGDDFPAVPDNSSWSPAPAGLEPYFDPFAGKANGHAR